MIPPAAKISYPYCLEAVIFSNGKIIKMQNNPVIADSLHGLLFSLCFRKSRCTREIITVENVAMNSPCVMKYRNGL